MPTPARRIASAALAAALLCGGAASAQDAGPPLRLGGMTPGGVRASATESWGLFEFNLQNRADVDRDARVLMFFDKRPDVQYGRDVWVPARSTLSTWVLTGPAGVRSSSATACDIQSLLYERTGGADRLVLPSTEERVRSRGVLYRGAEPSTAIVLDRESAEPPPLGQLPQPDSPSEEAVRLARTFRLAAHLSEHVHRVLPEALPTTGQAFDGIDHLILASDRLAQDPAGLRALRHWLEQGGRVWVMLDRVSPETVAPLLGDALDFQVVDRVGLTSFRIETAPIGGWPPPPIAVEEERPVEFVRVLLPPQERPRQTVNGWPAWFTRPVGRGKVLFTALGPRAWGRPRKRSDPPSPYREFPRLPVPTDALTALALELQPPPEESAFRLDDLRPLLAEDVGYSVVGRGTAVLVFGAFLLAALALGLALRKARRRELLGWIGPAAALGAAALFFALGESSRHSAPPTVAVAQIVDAVGGDEAAAAHGLMAVYRPDEGPVAAASDGGGFYEPDAAGAEGQTRSLVQTDMDAWHWENLSLPAGLRFAPFHCTLPTGEPITAAAHFGPDGVEGRLTAGPFRGLADAVLSPPNGRPLSVRLGADGSFRVGGDDALPKGQYLAGAVLSDRQQRRQEVYRKFLKPPPSGRPEGPDVLLAWAEPIDMHFTPVPDARTVGNALLAVPLRMGRPAPGGRVTVPGPLVPYQRILSGGPTTRPTLEATTAADQHLRFQLPASVLPLRVERARVSAKINAPGRRVAIAAWADGRPAELKSVDSPLDPIRVEVADEQLLRLDEDGGLHLNLSITDPIQAGGQVRAAATGDEKWTIEYLEVEIAGTAGGP